MVFSCRTLLVASLQYEHVMVSFGRVRIHRRAEKDRQEACVVLEFQKEKNLAFFTSALRAIQFLQGEKSFSIDIMMILQQCSLLIAFLNFYEKSIRPAVCFAVI